MKYIFLLCFISFQCFSFTVNSNKKSCLRFHEHDSLLVKSSKQNLQTSDGCVDDIVLNSLETNSNHLYSAANSILVNDGYKINSGSTNISMKAGQVITLKANTRVVKGNKYLARIEPCS